VKSYVCDHPGIPPQPHSFPKSPPQITTKPSQLQVSRLQVVENCRRVPDLKSAAIRLAARAHILDSVAWWWSVFPGKFGSACRLGSNGKNVCACGWRGGGEEQMVLGTDHIFKLPFMFAF
jgi:hypothetical protein